MVHGSEGRPLRVGLAGLGTVAQGLLELLRENKERISSQSNREIHITHIASRTPQPHVDIGSACFSTDIDSLFEHDLDVVVELIGGVDHARSFIESAIQKQLPVVTANKAVLAASGNELFRQVGHFGYGDGI